MPGILESLGKSYVFLVKGGSLISHGFLKALRRVMFPW